MAEPPIARILTNLRVYYTGWSAVIDMDQQGIIDRGLSEQVARNTSWKTRLEFILNTLKRLHD